MTKFPRWIPAIVLSGSLGIGIGLLPQTTSQALDSPPEIRLAPPQEPGEPLVVTGTIYEPDGRTPVAGARVLAYHADARGFYSAGGQDRQRARLAARFTLSRDGRFRIRTIRPGHYPGGGTPSHIHFEIETRDGRRSSTEMQFADDPVVSRADRARAGDRWSIVRPVSRGRDGIWRAEFGIRLPSTTRR